MDFDVGCCGFVGVLMLLATSAAFASSISALRRARRADLEISKLQTRLAILEQRASADPARVVADSVGETSVEAPTAELETTTPVQPGLDPRGRVDSSSLAPAPFEPVPAWSPPPAAIPEWPPSPLGAVEESGVAPSPVEAASPSEGASNVATSPPPRTVSLEEAIGARWFNWVGMIAILFSVGYALKYSFDQGWITPSMRFYAGLSTGAGLLGAGTIAERHRYTVLSRGFWGGGIGVLFLVFFAARRLLFDPAGQPILSTELAFAGMIASVGIGFGLAFVYDTRSTAVLAAIGGYLTPVLLRGGPDQRFLFRYLAILTFGLLFLGASKRWGFLRWIAAPASVLYFLGWVAAYGVGTPWVMAVYPFGFFLAFLTEAVAAGRRGRLTIDRCFVIGVLAPLQTVCGAWALAAYDLEGAFLLVTSLVLGAATVETFRRSDPALSEVLAKLAFLIFLTVPLVEPSLHGPRMSVVWALQGVGLLALRGAWRKQGIWWGCAALALSAGRLALIDSWQTLLDVDPFLPILNERGLFFLLVMIPFGFACRQVAKTRDCWVGVAPLVWWLALALPAVFLSLEVRQIFAVEQAARAAASLEPLADVRFRHTLTMTWSAYAAVGAWLFRNRSARILSATCLAFAVVAAGKFVLEDTVRFDVRESLIFFNTRFATASVLFLSLTIAARGDRWLEESGRVGRHLLLLMALLLEWRDVCGTQGWRVGHFTAATLYGLTALPAVYGLVLSRSRSSVNQILGTIFTLLAASKFLCADLALAPRAPYVLMQPRCAAASVTILAALLVARRAPMALSLALRAAAQVLVAALLATEILGAIRLHPPAFEVMKSGWYIVFAALAFQGLTLVFAGFRPRVAHRRVLGVVFSGVASLGALCLIGETTWARDIVLNTRFASMLVVGAAGLAVAEGYRRWHASLTDPARHVELRNPASFFSCLGHVVILLAATVEISDYFLHRGGAEAIAGVSAQRARQLGNSVFWAVYGIGMVISGLARGYRAVRWMALLLLIFTIFKVFVFDLSFLIGGYRILSFLALGAILVGVSYLYQRFRRALV